jgi:hypothetical protein
MLRSCALVAGLFTLAFAALAQQPATPPAKPRVAAPTRPPLFFKEEWSQGAKGGEHDIAQDSVTNPALELKLYGESHLIQVTGKSGDEGNPMHTWSGECEGPCGFTLRHKENMADLTGLARIRVNTKTSGFHQVRPMIKLADGTWYVGDRADGNTKDWLYSEYLVSDIKWLKLNIEKMVTNGNFVEPDLTKVDEIGFADLLPGSGHGPGGWSDVAQIEIYGKPVKRQ